jgi:hypothetical protein
MAAEAVEEAKENVKAIADEAVKETIVGKVEIDSIVSTYTGRVINGPCHVSGIFLPLRVNSLPLATIYEVKIPLRKWKKSLLQRNPAQIPAIICPWQTPFLSTLNIC